MAPPPLHATYRLQLTRAFGFAAAAEQVPYLRQLGISHLYLSPITMARPGSSHGYDVVDHNRLNPELGGDADFDRLITALHAADLGLIIDFVPNHMAASPHNPWWMDMLRHGQASRQAAHFDIDWRQQDGYRFPVINLPVLGSELDEALQRHEIVAAPDSLRYFDQEFPLSEAGRDIIARHGLDAVNGDTQLLAQLLHYQHYRLMFWRRAAAEINYRRFFDINELIGVRVDDPEVFEDMHRLLFSLAADGKIQGVRLDHIDGLRDPHGYCRRLQAALQTRMAGEPYVIVEKILEADEPLPAFPGVQGATGYEALNLLTDLFVDHEGWKTLRRLGRDKLGMRHSVLDAKKLVIDELFPGEFRQLVARLRAIAKAGSVTMEDGDLAGALKTFIIHLPVYRTYIVDSGISETDRKRILQTAKAAVESEPAFDTALNVLTGILLQPQGNGDETADFIARLQQFTGPVMAKAMEDTYFYRDVSFLALNEVGGDPRRDALSASDFHRRMAERQTRLPLALTATATHDTKRGEDARLRIAALAELADDWSAFVLKWIGPKKTGGTPAREHDYAFYQSLLGAWPGIPLDDAFLRRAEAYAVKAMRESKIRTSWLESNTRYEEAVLQAFRARLSDPDFVNDLGELAERAALIGCLYSLAQITLKTLGPGVPDYYQGTELWDLSFVDPDNRRPVDWNRRHALLRETAEPAWPALLSSWRDGRVKMALAQHLLHLRDDQHDLLSQGVYLGLPTETGERPNEILAFERRLGGQSLIVSACTRAARLTRNGWEKPDFSALGGSLTLPDGRYTDYLHAGRQWQGQVPMRDLLEDFPVSVLIRQ